VKSTKSATGTAGALVGTARAATNKLTVTKSRFINSSCLPQILRLAEFGCFGWISLLKTPPSQLFAQQSRRDDLIADLLIIAHRYYCIN
jgi:hypothetical protein